MLNYTNLKIFLTIGVLVLFCTFTFQNCASNFDPSAYTNNNSQSASLKIAVFTTGGASFTKTAVIPASVTIISADANVTCTWIIRDSAGTTYGNYAAAAVDGNCVSAMATPNITGVFTLVVTAHNGLNETASSQTNFLTTEPPAPTPSPTPTPTPPTLTYAVSLVPSPDTGTSATIFVLRATAVANIATDFTVVFGTITVTGAKTPLPGCTFSTTNVTTFSPGCTTYFLTPGIIKLYVDVSAAQGTNNVSCHSEAGNCYGNYSVLVIPSGT